MTLAIEKISILFIEVQGKRFAEVQGSRESDVIIDYGK